MSKTMRAAVYLGPEQIIIRSLPIPEPGPGELLVKIQAATTCGTDVKTYRRGHPKFPPPFIFGHEFGGDVVQVGKGVDQFREGMRVTANVFAECGHCFSAIAAKATYAKTSTTTLGLLQNTCSFLNPSSSEQPSKFLITSHMPMQLYWSHWSRSFMG